MLDLILKEALQAKLKISKIVIDSLPENIKEPVEDFQQSILKVVNEVTKDFIDESRPVKKEKGMKSVTIE